MIAQHVAEGGVLGEVGSKSESPGDGTVFTQTLKPRPFKIRIRSGLNEKSEQRAPRGLKPARDDKNKRLIGTTKVVP